jgi:hypothetical protein
MKVVPGLEDLPNLNADVGAKVEIYVFASISDAGQHLVTQRARGARDGGSSVAFAGQADVGRCARVRTCTRRVGVRAGRGRGASVTTMRPATHARTRHGLAHPSPTPRSRVLRRKAWSRPVV